MPSRLTLVAHPTGPSHRYAGESVDNCAICVMSRTSAPVLETGVGELVKPPTGGAIVDLPTPIQQPESTALPPNLASPEWHHEVAEGQKALLRRQGFSSGGPLKAIQIPPSSPATSGGSRSK